VRLLYGSRQSLKYKIKLNDKILDPNEADKKMSPRGKVATGITVPDTNMMKLKKKLRQEIRENDDIFETSKKLKLGPGQYAEKYSLVKHKSPVT